MFVPTEIFDLRLKVLLATVAIYISDVLDIAGKAGTMPMQVLLLAAVVSLAGVIIWQNKAREEQNKAREEQNKERHEENRKAQNELVQQLKVQQASIDAERVARIGKLMEQQADSIESQNAMAHAQQRLADAVNNSNRLVENLEKSVVRFSDYLNNNGK